MTPNHHPSAPLETDRADARLRTGRLEVAELEQLARQLAILHESETADPDAARQAGPDALAARARALRDEASRIDAEHPKLAAALRVVADIQARFFATHADWFQARVDAQCIGVGVYDLHLENVWIDDQGSVTLPCDRSTIEGMKYILDKTVEILIKKEKIPKSIQVGPSFRRLKSQAKFSTTKPNANNSACIFIPPFVGSNKPLVTYSELNRIHSLDDFCSVGIDLVSSENRETGFCILKGDKASTCRVKTDEEMINLALESGADLISIDSPLSIPKGRTSFFDDDPFREKFGITRECERILKRRGISSYPCLIPSMQKLTQRGMLLAEKFRKIGIPVIESYPGAAQDIISIPRKQAGLDYLVDGLKEFGLIGDFTHEAVSHDELDAITSAIVGHFFWVGMYEALGNPDEEYLIIPDLNADYKNWLSRQIVGISGQIGSGKTTVATYLHNNGYAYARYSQVLETILKKKGIEPSRSTLQEVGRIINEEKGPKGQRWLGKNVCDLLLGKKCGVVDGLRFLEDHALMVETYGPAFFHLHLTSPSKNRENRISVRSKISEDISIQDAEKNPVESGIERLRDVATESISNNGTLDDLFNLKVIRKLLRKKCQ